MHTIVAIPVATVISRCQRTGSLLHQLSAAIRVDVSGGCSAPWNGVNGST
jgi:hypothetical protein